MSDTGSPEPVGIIGAGRLGQALARTALRAGEIVIDATNALLFPDSDPRPSAGHTSSEIVVELVHGAWLVKTANTLGWPDRMSSGHRCEDTLDVVDLTRSASSMSGRTPAARFSTPPNHQRDQQDRRSGSEANRD
jgi:predicted dinucleotide-binding enzyme